MVLIWRRVTRDKRASRGSVQSKAETKKVKKFFRLPRSEAKNRFTHWRAKASALSWKSITPNSPLDLGRQTAFHATRSCLPDQKKDQTALFICFTAHLGTWKISHKCQIWDKARELVMVTLP